MMDKLAKNQQHKKYILLIISAIAIACAIACLVTFYWVKAQTPTAWVVSYGDQSSSGLTTSQLLEVKTSGFANNAQLGYRYSNQTQTDPNNILYPNTLVDNMLYIFPTTDTYQYELINGNSLFGMSTWDNMLDANSDVNTSGLYLMSNSNMSQYTTSKFLALSGNEEASGEIQIVVKDFNSESDTYGQSVNVTITLGAADLGNDVASGVAVMFVGETLEMRELLSRLGVTVLNEQWDDDGYYDTKLYAWETSKNTASANISTKTYTSGWFSIVSDMDIYITPSTAGYITGTLKIKAAVDSLGNQYYPYLNAKALPALKKYEAYTRIEVYDHKPTVTTNGYSIVLSDTNNGYIYTVGNMSQTASKDGDVLTFGSIEEPLKANVTYYVSMSSNNSNHLSKYDWQVYNEAQEDVTVTFDMNDNTGTTAVTQSYNTEFSSFISSNISTTVSNSLGMNFVEWNEKRDGTGTNYSEEPTYSTGIKTPTTVYAIWDVYDYTAEVTVYLDDELSKYDTVTLYQNGTKQYSLVSNEDGTYTYDAVQYSNDGNGSPNVYDIYINGVDTGVDIQWTGEESDGSTTKATVYCYDVSVDLQYSDYNETTSTSLTGQVVTLKYGNISYSTSYQNEVYKARLYYASKDDGESTGYLIPHNVYVNGVQATYEGEPTTVTPGGSIVNAEAKATINFYGAAVFVYKDNTTTGVASDVTVTLRQDGKTVYATESKALTSEESRNETGFYASQVMDNGYPYDIYVNGYDSESNTSSIVEGDEVSDVDYFVNSNEKIETLDYYTISYADGENTSKIYKAQILLAGDTYTILAKIVDSTRSFDYWSRTATDGDAISNVYGETMTVSESNAVTYYAYWSLPAVVIGDYIQTQTSESSTYTMPYLNIIGYNEEGNSIAQFQVSTVSSSTTISYDGITLPTGSSATGNGTSTVVFDMTGTSGGGITPSAAEAILRALVITPAFEDGEHTCLVEVWGSTL